MCLIIAVAVAGGCKKEKKQTDTGGSASGGTAAAPVADPNTVEITVDGQSVAKVALKDLDAYPRLDTLVPAEDRRLGTWMSIHFAGPNTSLEKPSQQHPDKVPVLFKNKDGKPAFGMFDPVEHAKHGEPGFRADAITKVEIKLSKQERGGDHQGGTGEGADPTKLVVEINTPQGKKQITGPEILKLPREPQPGNEDTKGWRVQQFLEAAGVTKYESVTLTAVNGASVPLTKKELDPATTVAFIKLNKQGELRFRHYTKQGDGWQPGADLRGLKKIDVK